MTSRTVCGPRTARGPRTLSHVARIRVLAGHTQASLAEAAGVSKGTVQRLERGHLPSAPTAARIAQVLDLDTLVIFPDLLDQ